MSEVGTNLFYLVLKVLIICSPLKLVSFYISEFNEDSTVLAFSEYVPGPASLLKYSLSSSLPSNLRSLELKGGTY
jgi:hypothetical protein